MTGTASLTFVNSHQQCTTVVQRLSQVVNDWHSLLDFCQQSWSQYSTQLESHTVSHYTAFWGSADSHKHTSTVHERGWLTRWQQRKGLLMSSQYSQNMTISDQKTFNKMHKMGLGHYIKCWEIKKKKSEAECMTRHSKGSTGSRSSTKGVLTVTK